MCRKPIILFFLLLSPFVFFGQKTLNGFWTGKTSNDSTTVRRDQRFELALTEYRGKVFGYSRTTFLVNDTLFYVLKRVKGEIDGDLCEIRDDEIISYNFPGKIDKGIKVTTSFRMSHADSSWSLSGKWSTNKTKKFYAITGKVEMQEETDPSRSTIFAHLQELRLEEEMRPALEQQAALNVPASSTANPVPVGKKPGTSEQPVPKQITPTQPAPIQQLPKQRLPKQPDPKKPGTRQPESTPAEPHQAVSGISKAATAASALRFEPGGYVHDRQTNIVQTLDILGDSLFLSLYDNGEVDGDTVSVLLDAIVVVPRKMLKVTAGRELIVLPPGKEEHTLVLYAENLGKYPPNTGLLVIRDGDNTYQIRFSADLKNNAAIILRRK